jgi:hypothetical protein
MFGAGVSLYGTTAAIGAHLDEDKGTNSGMNIIATASSELSFVIIMIFDP